MSSTRVLLFCSLGMLGPVAPVATQLPTYEAWFVGAGTPGAINDFGQVVFNDAGRARFFEPGAASVELPLPAEATSSIGRDLNNAGTVVGQVTGGALGARAAVWRRDGAGTWAVTLVPTGGNSDATGINDLGDVVGFVVGGGAYAFNDTDGLELLSPFGVSFLPGDVNNERVLVGRNFFGQGESFDLNTHVVTHIGLPTGTGIRYQSLDLDGINDAGDLCGRAVVATAQPDNDQAVRYDVASGTWEALNSPVPQAFAFDLDAAGNTLFAVGFSSPPYVRFPGQGTVDANTLLAASSQGWSVGLALGGDISDSGNILCTGGNGLTAQSGVVALLRRPAVPWLTWQGSSGQFAGGSGPHCGVDRVGLAGGEAVDITVWGDQQGAYVLFFAASPWPCIAVPGLGGAWGLGPIAVVVASGVLTRTGACPSCPDAYEQFSVTWPIGGSVGQQVTMQAAVVADGALAFTGVVVATTR